MNKSLLRKALLRNRNAGFTLVELMIVVAIIGVLAALAIYGVSRYLRHSKTAEATRSLASIETGEKAKYQNETVIDVNGTTDHMFCGLTPNGVDEQAGSPQPAAVPKAQKQQGVYTGGIWTCLKFALTSPQFYQYAVGGVGAGSTNNATYSAVAMGDLDGNTVNSTYTINGNVTGGEATRAGAMTVVNEDE